MASAAPGEWNYFGTITAPPASGQIRLDSATQKSCYSHVGQQDHRAER